MPPSQIQPFSMLHSFNTILGASPNLLPLHPSKRPPILASAVFSAHYTMVQNPQPYHPTEIPSYPNLTADQPATYYSYHVSRLQLSANPIFNTEPSIPPIIPPTNCGGPSEHGKQSSQLSRSTGTPDTFSSSTPTYTASHDLDDQISVDNTPLHEIPFQGDFSSEIDLVSRSDEHGEQSAQPNISLTQVFVDSYDYQTFLLCLELDTHITN